MNNPRLPERWVNRWVEEEMVLKEQGLSAFDLTPEELRALAKASRHLVREASTRQGAHEADTMTIPKLPLHAGVASYLFTKANDEAVTLYGRGVYRDFA